MPEEHPWSLLKLQSSTDPAASQGEAGSSTTKGVRAVARETAEMPHGEGSKGWEKWRLGDTYGREKGSKRRILQATNTHSDTASSAQPHQLAAASWGCSSTAEQRTWLWEHR